MSEDDRIARQNFNRLWDELQKPVRELKQQVASLSRQTARAEVAGAVEVVDALPSAGKKARILYLSTDDKLYYDNGSTWVEIATV